ncbi:MAG: hypothetical protein ACOVMS_03600 [Flavobacterium sp.]|jgi:hypothetical protein|uniref:hypothetical protein n=1 Tax=Flavobacterium sp. TaxID=239 RepID=UPI0037C018AB
MKFLSVIFLVSFLTFLVTPTVLGVIDNEADTSYFYSMCEEEENFTSYSDIESIQTNCISVFKIAIKGLTESSYFFASDLSFDNLAHQIFSPPPNFI